MECECTTSEYSRSRGIKACGHECLNRMLLIECSSNCPCGQWCTNRRFQRRSYANHKLALFKTEMKGYGLRTISSIRKGRFLAEYIGEVIDMDELARRNKKYKRDGNTHQYVMSLIHGTVIDSTIKGNWARFINHSCEPNCVAEKWLVNGEYRMGIFSKRDLNINEEITIDYRFETFGTVDSANEKCYCGAPTCRGTISVKTNSNNNTNNLNKRQTRRQTLDDDELLDCLHDDETNEYIIPKTIEEIRQLIQIMSRTDSENGRTIELNLIKNSSQKHLELPRLFLECNGLHVLCSWMKDILIVDDEQQQYSDEFKNHLLDFIHNVLPIKDRTTVIKNGLLDLVYKKLKLPLTTIDNITNNDQEQINNLMNSMLNHLDDPIIAKLL
jgi:histone-lysine N-methyltransferase SETD2